MSDTRYTVLVKVIEVNADVTENKTSPVYRGPNDKETTRALDPKKREMELVSVVVRAASKKDAIDKAIGFLRLETVASSVEEDDI